ncbi:heme exporter protein CcmD [Profundibacterium mesophilum]|uniref:Heme exporter protein D n=1 Tax=Profundibacterium mesophilum KAUST100406-0324 TaxID=1037889 RepID=A0A921NWG4_9RHOB|nr:heme exporter protein CcmD [Profundibacterium mesophilum]KAF0674813.1 Heme exporter protein D [Profundibacterium mesophilum KAUST100406-0324]
MPDLGKYAFEVTAAYAGSFALLGAIVFASWSRSRKARRDLAAAEGRRRNG